MNFKQLLPIDLNYKFAYATKMYFLKTLLTFVFVYMGILSVYLSICCVHSVPAKSRGFLILWN